MRLAVVSVHMSPLTPAGDLIDRGPARRVAELCQALAALGHEVRFFARADARHPAGTRPLLPGVTVVHIPVGPASSKSEAGLLSYTSRFGERLAEHWRRSGWTPDLVHAHFWLSGLAARTAAHLAQRPVALTYHELASVRRRLLGDAADPAARVDLERRLGNAVNLVIAQSRAERDELARLGVPRQRTILIPTGVDPGRFAPVRALARPHPGRGRIVAVGDGLTDRTGVVDLLTALRHLPEAEATVVGGASAGRVGRDRRVRELRALAREWGVADRVRFVGRIAAAELPAWYHRADVVVCAGWYAPSGVTALEAMAAGLPVVATAIGGQRDVVIDGVTGALVPPGAPGALARAVRRVLADPIRQLEYAAAGLDRVRQCYAWHQVTRQLDVRFRELCAAGAACA